jgi:hypothetical protein
MKKLEAFKELVQKKMCKYWTSALELGSVVSRSFINLQKTNPAIGWVRGDLVPEKDSSAEILELTREIERLHNQIEDTKNQAPKGAEKLAQGEDKLSIKCNFESTDEKYTSYTWNGTIQTTWNEIFYQISPLLIDEASEHRIRNSLNEFVAIKKRPEMKLREDAKGHRFSGFAIDEDNYQTIKVQFRALGLIIQSMKKRAVTDKGAYWTLTPYGDTIMNQLRAIKRENNDQNPNNRTAKSKKK